MSLCQKSARCRHVAVIPNPGRTYAAPHRCSREVSVGHQGWPLAVGLRVLLLLLQRLWGHSCTALSLGEQWDSAGGGSPPAVPMRVLCVQKWHIKGCPQFPKAGGNLRAVSSEGHLEARVLGGSRTRRSIRGLKHGMAKPRAPSHPTQWVQHMVTSSAAFLQSMRQM